MFQEAYQKAYEQIKPDEKSYERIQKAVADRRKEKRKVCRLKPAVSFACVIAVLLVAGMPTMARNVPQIYQMLEEYAPGIADYFVPVSLSDTKRGITMQVEAVQVEGEEATIFVSFADAGEENKIKGEVDLYDSYTLQSFGAYSNFGGCSFIAYDEEQDKAYFRIHVQSENTFSKSKLKFRVGELLTSKRQEEKEIDLSKREYAPETKVVDISGMGGIGDHTDRLESLFFSKGENEWEELCQVMKGNIDDVNIADSLTITGIGYTDGVLRIQDCRGDLSDADRHLELYFVDADGEERVEDMSVGWKEEVNGTNLTFTEHWFVVSEEELAEGKMCGTFHTTEKSIEGDWSVTFRME